MKMAKRILSLVLVLVMFASLSVTAFADDAGTVTINIVVDGVTDPHTAPAGITLQKALNNLYDEGEIEEPQWKRVADWEHPDVTHYALTGIGDVVSKTGTTTDLHAANQYLTLDEDDAVANHPGYYLISSDNGYHYVYVGYDWTYTSTTVNNGNLYTYMCCYTLTAGETVTITYSRQITDWTQENPLS